MKKYVFIGRVLPDFPKRVSYPVAPSVNPSKHGTLNFEIQKSIVTAQLEIDEIENTSTALKSTEQVIQGLVDSYSLVNGGTYEVKLEIIRHNGEEFVQKEASLSEILDDISLEDLQVEMLMSAAIEHMSLRFALSNFKNARRHTAYTGLFTYLAVENVKKYLYPEDLKRESEEWEGLRQTLDIKREDIEFIKVFADHARHGKYQDVSGTDNTKILRIGAEIIYKFYKYISQQNDT